jgi:hypothetical protein
VFAVKNMTNKRKEVYILQTEVDRRSSTGKPYYGRIVGVFEEKTEAIIWAYETMEKAIKSRDGISCFFPGYGADYLILKRFKIPGTYKESEDIWTHSIRKRELRLEIKEATNLWKKEIKKSLEDKLNFSEDPEEIKRIHKELKEINSTSPKIVDLVLKYPSIFE